MNIIIYSAGHISNLPFFFGQICKTTTPENLSISGTIGKLAAAAAAA